MVWLVLPDASGVYAEVAYNLRQLLLSELPRAVVRTGVWPQLTGAADARPQLLVTLGTAALETVVKQSGVVAPVLAALLPRASYEAVVGKDGVGNVSAVYLDQPVARYMALLHLLAPDRLRVGTLFGPESQLFKNDVLKAARARGLYVQEGSLEAGQPDVYPLLRSVLDKADVLLALPDSRVFNAVSMPNILIAAYRQRVPVFSYSAAHVKAGAAAALYVTPAQIARQTAKTVVSWWSGRSLPAPQMADAFAVAVNAQVGRSLGLENMGSEDVVSAITRMELGS